jgi:hypothetical protein
MRLKNEGMAEIRMYIQIHRTIRQRGRAPAISHKRHELATGARSWLRWIESRMRLTRSGPGCWIEGYGSIRRFYHGDRIATPREAS